jgi:hypothetical protein
VPSMNTTARMLPVAAAAEATNNHKTIVGTGYLTRWLSLLLTWTHRVPHSPADRF